MASLGESFQLAINPDCNNLFSGKKVLLTMSRNNNLQWIRDWVAFYAANHGINGVLIYDNNSDEYCLDELAETLAVFKKLEIVIVPWGFRFGPGRYPGGPDETLSDSKFCQLGGLEHARFRFLSQAAWVINADIDELLVARGGSIADDLALNPKSVGLSFKTQWVEALAGYGDGNRVKSFSDYFHFDRAASRSSHNKWIVVPSKVDEKNQWLVHGVKGISHADMGDMRYFAHFRGINTNWKSKRNTPCRYNPARHEMDGALVGHMLKALPQKMKRSMNEFMTSVVNPA